MRERQEHAHEISGKLESLLLLVQIFDTCDFWRSVLSFTQRQQLLFADVIAKHVAGNSADITLSDSDDHGIFESESQQSAHDPDSDWDDEEDIALSTLPPGEEGFYNSHQGGEAILSNLIEDMTSR